MQSRRVNTLPFTFSLFLLPLAFDAVAAPAVLVAASSIDSFGGGGAGLRGVFWLLVANGRLSGDTVFRALISILSAWTGTFSNLSKCSNGACLFLLKVGGASFSWSCADGRSSRGAGTLNDGTCDVGLLEPGRWELDKVGGGGDFDLSTEFTTSLELIGLPEAKSRYATEKADALFGSEP